MIIMFLMDWDPNVRNPFKRQDLIVRKRFISHGPNLNVMT